LELSNGSVYILTSKQVYKLSKALEDQKKILERLRKRYTRNIGRIKTEIEEENTGDSEEEEKQE
jgi:hypothetical protein